MTPRGHGTLAPHHRGGDLHRVPAAAKRVATVAKVADELASGAGKFWPQRIFAGRVTFIAKSLLCARLSFALVAQLDRASDFEAVRRFAPTTSNHFANLVRAGG